MTHPNIIYILADDMGYGDVSALNPDSKIRTPNIDRLAAEGLACTDAHSSSAVCTPSRYSILTGRYNWRSWLKRSVIHGYGKPVIESDRLTVPGMLSQHGYHTACIGKWHLGWYWAGADGKATEENQAVDFTQPIIEGPTTRGFDYFFGFAGSLDMPPYVYVENDRPTAVPNREVEATEGYEFYRGGPIAPDFSIEDCLPNLTRHALRYIDEHAAKDNPFFLYFPLPAPHTPILPTPEFQGKSGTNPYGDFCLQVDDVVGQVLAKLDEQGIADNTIVIFTSDNGCSPMANFDALKEVGHHPSYHFRGHKADIYEGGHRIPYLMRWPAQIPAGITCDDTVCLVDLMASLAQIVGFCLPNDAAEDSFSNLPVWRGEALSKPLRDATVHHSINGSFSIRRGRWKLEMCPGSGGWSFPKPGPDCEGLPDIQLYDLEADIGERENVYDQYPAVVEEMKALLRGLILSGRSTPGAQMQNHPADPWPGLEWLDT